MSLVEYRAPASWSGHLLMPLVQPLASRSARRLERIAFPWRLLGLVG